MEQSITDKYVAHKRKLHGNKDRIIGNLQAMLERLIGFPTKETSEETVNIMKKQILEEDDRDACILHKDDFINHMVNQSDYPEIDIQAFADCRMQNRLSIEENEKAFIEWYSEQSMVCPYCEVENERKLFKWVENELTCPNCNNKH